MSVNINFKPSTNNSKWETVKSGDFVVLEGTPEHPIPQGLYRVFIITEIPTEAIPTPPHKNIFVIPMFDGPFDENMFPYMLSNFPLPTLIQKINRINIEVETN
jgi:hypothetical protein